MRSEEMTDKESPRRLVVQKRMTFFNESAVHGFSLCEDARLSFFRCGLQFKLTRQSSIAGHTWISFEGEHGMELQNNIDSHPAN